MEYSERWGLNRVLDMAREEEEEEKGFPLEEDLYRKQKGGVTFARTASGGAAISMLAEIGMIMEGSCISDEADSGLIVM